jgi:hypothetical protein
MRGMTSSSVDIARIEGLANTLAQGLESLLAELSRRQDEESKQLLRYKCIAAQVCEISLITLPTSHDEKSNLALDQELLRW